MFKGTATALITPFDERGIDYDSFGAFIDRQIEQGIDALLVCGTTGEPATMTATEKLQVIEWAIKYINHRVPTIIGTGSNCTATAIENTKFAEKIGADYALVVTPYYNKCTQEGLYQHYKAINDNVSLPIIAYNVPSRTGVNILPETARRLSDLGNLKGIKEACGNIEQIKKTYSLIKDSDTLLYSGDDGIAVDVVEMGGAGVLSVASNVIPGAMSNMIRLALNGNIEEARKEESKYAELFKALFYEVNPIPAKYACSRMGLCKNLLRLPLTTMSDKESQRLEKVLQQLRLI
ncbi:MAG: 4-hydroxy-tetrahydrodipicolinate synthase [Christensenellales bacterium]